MRRTLHLLLALALLAAAVPSLAADGITKFPDAESNTLIVNGHTFDGWEAYFKSDYFRSSGMRCLTPEVRNTVGPWPEGGTDCTGSSTNPDPSYDPGMTYQVPVVVHIIENDGGTQGVVPDERVYSQIDVLNEDFQALAGSNGAPGTFTGLRFVMADEDPLTGLQTNGITRSNNTSWYNDSGAYWNTLSWDPSNFMNIYTNSASGALGYVPGLPQDGIAGTAGDRVVILDTTFGKNAPFSPFDLGRTGTHELGHYFGLEHTFSGGCGTATMPGCYTSGDLICDTNAESNPYFGCGAPRSTCSSLDPRENYMDYSDDICMNQFTQEQMRRIRCTIQGYRASLYEPIEPDQLFLDDFESGDTNSWDTAGGSGSGTLLSVTGAAAIEGSNGLEASFDGSSTVSDYLVDEGVGGLDRYRARFYLDTATLTMDTNKRFKIFTLLAGAPNYRLATLVLRYNNGDYFLRAKAHDDPSSAAWNQIAWATLDNANPNIIEIDWKRSSGPGNDDGYLRLWVNRRPIGEAININNDERAADFVRIGVAGGLDVNTNGDLYFDNFESRESLYIGN
ncbi:MAG: zinc metalloprotease [Acidobacteriota bacterium]|nr:zinc metalloprotease [Acidobacteriota bacterium]